MAHREILLLQPQPGLGAEGDIVKVRAGFARNYLLPRKLAAPVTLANRKHVEALRARRTAREATELAGARELGERLKVVALAFAVKTGAGGKMFGSITQADLHERLEKEGFKFDKKFVHLAGGHVKTLGKHEATIKLHPEVVIEISFEVVSENPIEEAAPAPAEFKPSYSSERRPAKARSEPPAAETAAPATVADNGEPAAPAPKHKKRVRHEVAGATAGADEKPSA